MANPRAVGGEPPAGAPPSATLYERAPLITFGMKGVPPPAPYYVTKDDVLWIGLYNSNPLVTVRINYRLLRPDGDLIPGAIDLTPASDRSRVTWNHQLTDGFLLNVAVVLPGGNPKRGQLWVAVGLRRSAVSAADEWAVLLADYLVPGYFPSWPVGRIVHPAEGPGMIRSITGTDPAAGVEISETVPTNARWRVLGVRYALVTDANVATRTSHLIFDDGAAEVAKMTPEGNQVASVTVQYTYAHGARSGSIPSTGYLSMLPVTSLLSEGWRIRTSTTNMQVGDNYGAPQLWVEEWIEH
jgi:hypothetical protein